MTETQGHGNAYMKILVFGKTGQLATELQRRTPADIALCPLGRNEADLADPAACARIIDTSGADAIINAAAYTAVDRAETEEPLARRINGEAPAAMARAAARRDIPFLHVSSDYVFEGTGNSPWRPDDTVCPQNAYGRSKLAGEQGVRAAGGRHVILRTSWVFSAHGTNFVRTMLRLGAERDRLSIVADQIGGPTPAADIAATLLQIAMAFHAGTGRTGTYHFAGAPAVSWADFARETFRLARLDVTVEDIPTAAYPTPAARPLNSRLDGTTLRDDYGITPADWRAGLSEVLNELGHLP